ncbi:MAG: hypothetical protein NTY53_24315 [Kiritimatiellaeota bacterium]|nr:hypothetical protein [Kiritimatiellota bacterium]
MNIFLHVLAANNPNEVSANGRDVIRGSGGKINRAVEALRQFKRVLGKIFHGTNP